MEPGFYDKCPVHSSRPPDPISFYTSKKRQKHKNTQGAMISFSTLYNLLLLVAAAIVLIPYDTKWSDNVSASSLPPLLSSAESLPKESGKVCDKSRIVMKARHGFISSGPKFSNYSQNTHCEWLIKPSNSFRSENNQNDSMINSLKNVSDVTPGKPWKLYIIMIFSTFHIFNILHFHTYLLIKMLF